MTQNDEAIRGEVSEDLHSTLEKLEVLEGSMGNNAKYSTLAAYLRIAVASLRTGLSLYGGYALAPRSIETSTKQSVEETTQRQSIKSVPFFGPGGILDILNVLGSRERSSLDEIISNPHFKITADTLKLVVKELAVQGFLRETVRDGKFYYSLTDKAKRLGPLNQIEVFSNYLKWLGGNDVVKEKVVEGIDLINASSSDREVAEWYRSAMKRLDQLVQEDRRNLIMQNCGYHGCAFGLRDYIEAIITERNKYRNMDEFLDAQVRNGELTREGNILYYTIQPWKDGVRCLCSLVNSLPEDETVSPTYCQCTAGFVKKYMEEVLMRPVEVKLIHSTMSGARDCKFAIHI